MKKAYRVRKNEEFSSIIKKRHSKASSAFVIYANYKAQKNARVGISVSKKLGGAVERNKIKRQLRMMLQELIDFEECNFDYIVIVRNAYLNNSYAENKKCLEKSIKNCKIK